jgi:hypothetical protein
MVWSQLRQIVCDSLSQKNPSQTKTKNRAGGVAQGVDPEFKSQYCTHTHTNHRCDIWTFCWNDFSDIFRNLPTGFALLVEIVYIIRVPCSVLINIQPFGKSCY